MDKKMTKKAEPDFLMKGDCLLIASREGKGTDAIPVRVAEVRDEGIVVDTENDIYDAVEVTVETHMLCCRPLTIEILREFFPNVEDAVLWSPNGDDDGFKVNIESEDGTKTFAGVLYYCYELQQALRLCGYINESKLGFGDGQK